MVSASEYFPTPTKLQKHVRKSAPRSQPSSKAVAVYRQQDGPFAVTGGGVGFPKFFRPTAFPPRRMCRHAYSELKTLTGGLLNLFGTEVVYRLNSLYDPNFSGIGDYPADYLEMKALYASYFVKAVVIDLTYTDPSADGVLAAALITPAGSGVSLTSMTVNVADGRPTSDVRPLNNTGMQSVRIQKRFTIAQLEGLTEPELAGISGYRSVVGSNPTLTPFLRIAVTNTGASSQPTAAVLVRLTFEAEWYDRIVQTD